ncbi:MAG: hypothetical protein A2622_10530 [Bdellovibrionales bacterium RIFCSPHIGHO2_01_FULL_40_29]|nr:MAG: hypothetical protein A2622_10530 [Bdellovibrionales bacterium RIFCSPHIGHO2_01_FULL_40_29]OFZ34395.1 MAG: hypothetical protein A3D17_00795 [Bdellovibrionales bacterium RIFCSPHIGHO2_02_FULL_40_15]
MTAEDLYPATVHRRLKKISQSHAQSILFDWTDCQNPLPVYDGIWALFSGYKTEHLLTSFIQLSQLKHLTESPRPVHFQIRNSENLIALDFALSQMDDSPKWSVSIHFSPRTQDDIASLKMPFQPRFFNYQHYFWDFRVFNPALKRSLTINDIHHALQFQKSWSILKIFQFGHCRQLEIWNDAIPTRHELEAVTTPAWEFSTSEKKLKISIVIPSFNNSPFLANVIEHLVKQTLDPEFYEIIVVEDGGTDNSSEVIQTLFANYSQSLNLKFIYWSKSHPTRGDQNFFRAGLARNLGVQFSSSDHLIFLDSDILVPPDFLEICLQELKTSDLIQFQRFHIQQELSLKNPSYAQVQIKKQTYIEEHSYWNQLFQSPHWQDLPQHWKYTCTYALGMKKSDFLSIGRFKKYYVSYGFEDTDLGYEFHRLNKTFKLVKTPLLHLTAYNHMQYKNSQFKRTQLLRKTAALFYLQHLDSEIHQTLGNFYRFERSLIDSFKNLLL